MLTRGLDGAQVRIVLISDHPGKIREVSDDLRGSAFAYGIVTVRASHDLFDDLAEVLSIRSKRLPTIVIVDYATCPMHLFEIMTAVNAFCGGTGVEYVVLDAPQNPRLRSKLKVLGVTLHGTACAAQVVACSIN
jgi:hypothetical protein